jgi:peptidoglycan/LPS O-acetylase OafA/YrhL
VACRPSIPTGRLCELDGLRGWASVSVMLSHLLFGVFVRVDPPVLTPWIKGLLEPLLGGTLDVAVFFVVSGHALSISYWTKSSRKTVPELVARRYVRLTVPVLASCLIVFALDEFGLLFHREAASLLHVEDWLGTFLHGKNRIVDLLVYAAVGVFCCHTQDMSLNPFLGTMKAELAGSALVISYVVFDRRIGPKSIVLLSAFAIFLSFDSFLACFPIGVLCGYFQSRGYFRGLGGRSVIQIIANLAFCAALIVGTYCNRIWPGWLLPSIVASSVLVVSVHASGSLGQFFAWPFSRWLGRISFPLYLTHFPVIVSFTSGSVLLAHAYGALNPVIIWIIIISSAALSLLVAVFFLPTEALTVRLSDLVARLIVREGYTSSLAYKLKRDECRIKLKRDASRYR